MNCLIMLQFFSVVSGITDYSCEDALTNFDPERPLFHTYGDKGTLYTKGNFHRYNWKQESETQQFLGFAQHTYLRKSVVSTYVFSHDDNMHVVFEPDHGQTDDHNMYMCELRFEPSYNCKVLQERKPNCTEPTYQIGARRFYLYKNNKYAELRFLSSQCSSPDLRYKGRNYNHLVVCSRSCKTLIDLTSKPHQYNRVCVENCTILEREDNERGYFPYCGEIRECLNDEVDTAVTEMKYYTNNLARKICLAGGSLLIPPNVFDCNVIDFAPLDVTGEVVMKITKDMEGYDGSLGSGDGEVVEFKNTYAYENIRLRKYIGLPTKFSGVAYKDQITTSDGGMKSTKVMLDSLPCQQVVAANEFNCSSTYYVFHKTINDEQYQCTQPECRTSVEYGYIDDEQPRYYNHFERNCTMSCRRLTITSTEGEQPVMYERRFDEGKCGAVYQCPGIIDRQEIMYKERKGDTNISV